MPWLWVAAASLIAGAAALAFVFWMRARHIEATIGTFECALRRDPTAHMVDGWAAYTGSTLCWYPVVGLLRRPALSWERDGLDILESVPIVLARTDEVLRRVTISSRGDRADLVMRDGSYSGLRSWLEAAPPSWRNVHPSSGDA